MSYKLKKRWYVIQTVSSFEGRVAQYLDEYIKINDMEELFGDVIIPSEKVIEISGGIRKREKNYFKGYVLVQMIMNYASWHLVRSIPRIMGFIGGTYDRPAPISDKEVYAIMHSWQHFCAKKKKNFFFEPGDLVKVNEGPYSDFNGIVEKVDYEKSILKLSLSILGRATYIELGFSKVKKK